MDTKTVLIIGGGVAGANFSRAAKAAGLKTILVDKKEFFSVPFAVVRASVVPKGAVGQQHVFKYADMPTIGTFKQGTVVELTADTAKLASGDTIKFDYAVIATGSNNGGGAYVQSTVDSLEQRKAELQDCAEKIMNAKSIVLVGGGPVGIEMAAEILETYAGKQVTLVHSGPRLLETKSEGLGKKAEDWLKSKGAKIIYNDRANKEDSTDGGLKLRSGQTISADLVLWTFGSKPNTEWLRSTSLSSILDDKGFVKVDPSLRVQGHKNLFAIGDITDVKEVKLGYLAQLHAELTAKNITALIKKGDTAKLDAWKPNNGTEAMFVSLGSGAGVGHMGGCTCPGFMVANIKAKDLFVSMTRKTFKVK
mmetsp:Transcript_24199/g.52882  ORF Transcript_24199/g.52882 Transcript_24199/m.52882 type:complete len:364 (+) Transcript_24199:91-1182(+)|eukprot:CAMPEP_0202909720 /NCGR_PEP_ID=MMETSP1392-20130828/50133_1 /ASSEMBLY_ACC=CAM_ASM_000868 /TAXON_ID=225041 /ORGANISM="Chlamydomonas chlamydogama, Strain SAG 11-48b" /LENGTH=363 /DNA_ID=CAMNT_0049599571 /DNA_START=70 /DNA_END=1161 /DNA_ORIENTATION=-